MPQRALNAVAKGKMTCHEGGFDVSCGSCRRVELHLRHGVLSNSTTKVRHFEMPLMLFGSLWRSLMIIGDYCCLLLVMLGK